MAIGNEKFRMITLYMQYIGHTGYVLIPVRTLSSAERRSLCTNKEYGVGVSCDLLATVTNYMYHNSPALNTFINCH